MSLLRAVVGQVGLEVRVEPKRKNTSLRAGVFHYKVVNLEVRFPQQALHQSC
jgi:hypothetical protein